jgi:uncharacterized protein (TIRG00374 family)
MGRIARWAIRLIGPVLLVFFFIRSNPAQLWANLQELTIWPILVSLGLFPIFLIVKSWRWSLVMRELGMQPPRLSFVMALYTIGLYTGGLTPGQSGDFIKGWYLRERGLPLAPVLFSILLDRLFDFAVMAGLALVGLVALVDVFSPDLQVPLQNATIAFAVIIFLTTPLLMARRPREWGFGLAERILPQRFAEPVARIRGQFAQLDLRAGPLVGLLGASALSATSTLIRVGVLYLTMPLSDIPISTIVGTTALIAILQALPISFAGVGVRDAVLIALFTRYGYTPEQALLLSAQFLLINIEHIVLGFLVSLRYPLVGSNQSEQPNP